MNENIETLIRELADKLGVTAKHLWEVLITQAPITGSIHVLSATIAITAIAISFHYLKKASKKEYVGEGMILLWGIWLGITILIVLVILEALPMTFAAFFNPEYWALKQLIP